MYDKIIIGAGLYGLYAGMISAKKGEKVLILEKDQEAFMRATYINQARVHLGYHYPRSLSTAQSTAKYFDKFINQFPECIEKDFDQIYATSTHFSWTDGKEFKKFSQNANIPCEEVAKEDYFKQGMVDNAFLTKEVTFDAIILRDKLLEEIKKYNNVEIKYSQAVIGIKKENDVYKLITKEGEFDSCFVLNATYASVNEICELAGFEPFKIKYELCEVILCKVNDELKNVGITVMDGPFFSIMPFGKSGYHSLTSVTFTPHKTSFDTCAIFSCQKNSEGKCNEKYLGNCNNCPAAPKSAWGYMSQLAKKYMLDKFEFEYVKSLYSMKPILKASDVDDSRPTCIKVHTKNPTFVSVLSGKITTVYDLEEVL